MTYDGFKYHVNVMEIIEKLDTKKLNIGKEKSITCAENQAYYQQQTRKDNIEMNNILKTTSRKIEGQLNDWQLTMIVNLNTNEITGLIWESSFNSVNLHSHHN